MPGIKAVVRKDEVNSAGQANIKIRVSHRGKVRYIGTAHYIDPRYMGPDGIVKPLCPSQGTYNKAILALLKEYQDIINDIEQVSDISMEALMVKLRAGGSGASFTDYMQQRIASLASERRHSLRDLYAVTLKHATEYSGQESIRFKEITVSWLAGFEKHLKINGASVNTIRNYMCNIRAVFNHAIDNGVIKQDMYPFRKYRPRQEKKRPRVLTITDLKALLAYRDKTPGGQRKAIDVFFLILYLGGINLKDLLYLQHTDLVNGRIMYRRFKTGRQYSVLVTPQARKLLTRYRGKKYLIDLIEVKEKHTASHRRSEMVSDIRSNINARLKMVGIKLALPEKPTTYVARYSFATIAFSAGVERDVIRMILGHGMNSMTDLYIDYGEAQNRCDKAMRLVAGLLKS